MTDENVLVIAKHHLDEVLGNYSHKPAYALVEDLFKQPMQFMPRGLAEQNPAYKQIIPYVVFMIPQGDSFAVFQYQRGKGGGEQRLHAKRSIGFGGHINDRDFTGDFFLCYCCGDNREINEELSIPIFDGTETEFRLTEPYHILNDDSDPVGEVHLGIVHTFMAYNPDIRAREKDLGDAGWYTREQLLENIEQFENWSKLLIKKLEEF